MSDEYADALTHVAYEYAALESAAKLNRTAPTTPILIVAFDSFLVHYRSLIEFFHATRDRERMKPEDIRAQDYVSEWTTPDLPMWKTWGPDMHILLAHLSTKRNRIHEEKAGIDHRVHFSLMLDEIKAAWSLFERRLIGTIHDGKLGPLLEERRRDFGSYLSSAL